MRTTIYNGAPGLQLEGLKLHREVKMSELWGAGSQTTDYGLLDHAHIRQFVEKLPNDRTYEFDLEGDPTRSDINRHLWDFRSNPKTAIDLRMEFLWLVNTTRSDLDIGLWDSVDHPTVREAMKNPLDRDKARQLGEAQAAFSSLSKWQDSTYISMYWRFGPGEPTEEQVKEWLQELDLKVALAQVFHWRVPKVYLWHRGYNMADDQMLDPDLFDMMVSVVAGAKLPIVFWAKQADRDFPKSVQRTLIRYMQ